MNIKPLADRVLILPAPAEEKTIGGIIIPDTAKEFSIKIPASSNHVIHCEAKDTTGTSLLRIVNGAYARACCTA